MVETDMQTMFRNHLEKHPPQVPEAYELKICKKNQPLPFDRVPQHQIDGLVGAGKGLFHKIQDQPWGTTNKFRFTKPKPFDCLYLSNIQGYVIIWWFIPNTTKVFIKIKIEDFLEEKKNSPRKSLTKERAFAIGEPIAVDWKK